MSDAKVEPPKRQRWYLHAESQVYGPYDKAALADMIARSQMLRDDKVHIEGGSTWIDAEDEPTLGPLFSKYSAPLAEPPPRKTRRRLSWLRFVPALLFLLVVGWVAWPYYAVFSLMTAVHDGDIATLEKSVDWPSVRQALRGDLNASLLKVMNDKGSADDAMGKGFAALLGPAVINNMVDGYVTPQGVAALARNQKPPESPPVGFPAFKNIDQIRKIDWDKVTYAFFAGSPFSFRVDVRPPDAEDKRPIGLELGWSGDWRLLRIRLPSDLIGTQFATNERLNTPSKRPQQKIAEPTPIELTLLSKKYREADFRSRPPVDAAIEFELSIVNKTQKPLRAFDGVLTFTDLLDNELLSTKLAINQPLPMSDGPGVLWSGELEYNQFMDSHKRLRSTELQNIKIRFVPRKFLYTDGSTKEFN